MKNLMIALILVSVFALAFATVPARAYTPDCWGQATAAFAQLQEMGLHASQQPTPREGLPNLARYLYYEVGVLDAPTVQALAAYLVSVDPSLTIEACMD